MAPEAPRFSGRATAVPCLCGTVTAAKRFGSALSLHVHSHVIVLDGVHAPGAGVPGAGGRLRFHALVAPKAQERRAWTELIVARAGPLLLRLGLWREDGASDDAGEPLSVIDACQAASVRNVAATGARAGWPLRKIVLPGLARSEAGAEGRAIGECSAALPRRACKSRVVVGVTALAAIDATEGSRTTSTSGPRCERRSGRDPSGCTGT